MKLRWLPAALKDLQRLYDFLEQKDPYAALRATMKIRESANSLINFPLTGVTLPGDPFRELYIPFGKNNYILRYRLENDSLFILRVWHSREQRK